MRAKNMFISIGFSAERGTELGKKSISYRKFFSLIENMSPIRQAFVDKIMKFKINNIKLILKQFYNATNNSLFRTFVFGFAIQNKNPYSALVYTVETNNLQVKNSSLYKQH